MGNHRKLLRRWKIPEKAVGHLQKGRLACGGGGGTRNGHWAVENGWQTEGTEERMGLRK